MAWTASGIYVATFLDAFDTTQLAIDLDLETHKMALYTNTETPNFSTETAYAATNEVTGTNWAAGGVVVTTTTFTESPTGTAMFDAADQVTATVTVTAFRGGKIYADALAGNNLIVGINFVSDFVCTAGTLTFAWNALGIATFDLTP